MKSIILNEERIAVSTKQEGCILIINLELIIIQKIELHTKNKEIWALAKLNDEYLLSCSRD